MKETLHLYCDHVDKELACRVEKALQEREYDARMGESAPSASDFVIFVFSNHASEGGAFKDNPWLKSEFDFSSYRGFRLMPLFVYKGSEGLEESFNEDAEEFYEGVFSGEFKPYGFDLEANDPLEEFPRVLEEYSE